MPNNGYIHRVNEIEHIYKTLFYKTPTIDGISRSIEGQDSGALGLSLTPHKNNSISTKIASRFKFDGQIINMKGWDYIYD